MYSWFRARKFDVRERILEALGLSADKLTFIDHHDAHMAAAFFCSDFDRATIVTIDGVGEYDTATWGVGDGTGLSRRATVRLPHSLGLFYSAMTAFLGFEVNEGEYKVMGMAGFGKPTQVDTFRSLFSLHDDGTFTLDQDWFNFLTPREVPYRPAMLERLGPPRRPEAPFATLREDLPEGVSEAEASAILEESRHYADIAASVQKCAEEVILHMVNRAVAHTGIRNVCLAGGVALNSLANGRLIREQGLRLYVQPAAGDAGSALGAALYWTHVIQGAPRAPALTSAYLGRAFDETAVASAVRDSGFQNIEVCPDEDTLVERVATLLAQGSVIGWFQGRAEWGPRALGHRSILADPTSPRMKRIVNERIKFREPFRPFAPVVPLEAVHDYFECEPIVGDVRPEFFMLAVHPVREEKRSILPAITHVDNTARVQVVTPSSNPLFHRLLRAFEKHRGVPVLLNTSFNLRGEPVVDSPADALKTFALSGLDYVVLHNTIVDRKITL
ncbi:MAG: carbamoyltransferase [Alphaproteobacteria bacterium]